MSFKKILGKKTLVIAGSALATGLATGWVYVLRKNATMEAVSEVVNEKEEDNKIVEVDFQEENNKEETQQEETQQHEEVEEKIEEKTEQQDNN